LRFSADPAVDECGKTKGPRKAARTRKDSPRKNKKRFANPCVTLRLGADPSVFIFGAPVVTIPGVAADPSPGVPESDLLTIAAIAIAAASISGVIHEAIGHGGMCLATGGHPLALSTVHFECSSDNRMVAAGGTLANLLFGTLALYAARTVKQSASLRYFFWLLMTFNLLRAGGYFLFSGVGNFGDWAEVIAGLRPEWAWRGGLVVLGAVTYFLLFVPLCMRELRPFLRTDALNRVRRARRLTLVPYLTAGILSCIAGALNPVGPSLILLSAAASSFGGDSGLAWMWNLARGPIVPITGIEMPGIGRNWGWVVTAIILAASFIAVLGPGVKFD
jgi:hypothetical protein